MHFEYIADAVSHGLMKTQNETGTPVIFGVLTCLTDEQAFQRAGMSTENPDKNHNHGDVRRPLLRRDDRLYSVIQSADDGLRLTIGLGHRRRRARR
jgi:hypothetical protein